MPCLRSDIPLRYGDIDRQGHVNNSAVLQIVESARLALWRKALLPAEPGQVIRRQSIEYLAPISAEHDSVVVEHECVKIGNSSYTLRFRVAGSDGALFSEGALVMVAVDPHGSPHPIPRRLREELEALMMPDDHDGDRARCGATQR